MTTRIATLPPRKEAAKRILEAIERKELQAQQPGFEPHEGWRYAGPCAVGVLMAEEQRTACDRHDTTIGWLIVTGRVSAKAPAFYRMVQQLHDGGLIDELELRCRRVLAEGGAS